METKIVVGLALFAVLAAIVVVVWNNRRTKRTFDRIEKMLDDAAEGRFTEESFDESRLSALETRFAHYLASSAISARNVSAERDKIKSLISDISHQTKTPIANLLLYSELLSEQNLSEETAAEVAAVHTQAEKLRFLIDALVKLSRLENGILTLSPRQESLQPVFQAIYEQYCRKAEGKGLVLTVQDTELSAFFDPKWTAEALGNLVDNAVKYTETGSVTVSAVGYDLFTRIDITDTGIGISEEELPKIFSRFYRGKAAKDEEGVGVGLYLAREIISSEGGYIKAVSAPGQGSTFSVFLPRTVEKSFNENP